MSKPPASPDRTQRQVSRQRGLDAESRVALDLQANGWTVLGRNWRGGGGELDLIVQRDGMLRFVEVKHRRHLETDAVSPAQVRRLRNAASAWMQEQSDEWWKESCFWLVVTQPNGHCEWQLDPF